MGRKRGRKRANGEGTVFPYRGRWCGQVTLCTDPISGKPKRITVYADTQAKCREQLQKAQQASDDSPLTVGAATQFWLTSHQDKLDPATAERYLQEIAVFDKKLRDLPIAELSAMDLDLWLARLNEAGVSADKRRRGVVRLRQILKKCQARGLVRSNVAQLVTLPRVVRREIHPLDAAQVRHLLYAAEGQPIAPLVRLALDSGGRLGELLALTWADIDLASGDVFFNKSLKERNGQFRIKTTKTKKGRRRVLLTAQTTEVFRRLSSQRQQDQRAPGDRLVFVDKNGGYVRQSNLSRRHWKPLVARAGLPVTTRFHDLRHTCATLLLLANVHPKVVSERLGHASIEITLNTYSHLLPGIQTTATEALSAIL